MSPDTSHQVKRCTMIFLLRHAAACSCCSLIATYRFQFRKLQIWTKLNNCATYRLLWLIKDSVLCFLMSQQSPCQVPACNLEGRLSAGVRPSVNFAYLLFRFLLSSWFAPLSFFAIILTDLLALFRMHQRSSSDSNIAVINWSTWKISLYLITTQNREVLTSWLQYTCMPHQTFVFGLFFLSCLTRHSFLVFFFKAASPDIQW